MGRVCSSHIRSGRVRKILQKRLEEKAIFLQDCWCSSQLSRRQGWPTAIVRRARRWRKGPYCFLSRLLTRLRKGASAAPSNLYIFLLFAGLLEVAGPGFELGTP